MLAYNVNMYNMLPISVYKIKYWNIMQNKMYTLILIKKNFYRTKLFKNHSSTLCKFVMENMYLTPQCGKLTNDMRIRYLIY